MEIKKVISDKKEFLELLLLADEQESMIDRYLERGDMFVLYDNGLKACCVVTREGEGIYEIKNIATISFFQRQGYGKRLIQFLFDHYRGKCSELLVGTGDKVPILWLLLNGKEDELPIRPGCHRWIKVRKHVEYLL